MWSFYLVFIQGLFIKYWENLSISPLFGNCIYCTYRIMNCFLLVFKIFSSISPHFLPNLAFAKSSLPTSSALSYNKYQARRVKANDYQFWSWLLAMDDHGMFRNPAAAFRIIQMNSIIHGIMNKKSLSYIDS